MTITKESTPLERLQDIAIDWGFEITEEREPGIVSYLFHEIEGDDVCSETLFNSLGEVWDYMSARMNTAFRKNILEAPTSKEITALALLRAILAYQDNPGTQELDALAVIIEGYRDSGKSLSDDLTEGIRD